MKPSWLWLADQKKGFCTCCQQHLRRQRQQQVTTQQHRFHADHAPEKDWGNHSELSKKSLFIPDHQPPCGTSPSFEQNTSACNLSPAHIWTSNKESTWRSMSQTPLIESSGRTLTLIFELFSFTQTHSGRPLGTPGMFVSHAEMLVSKKKS